MPTKHAVPLMKRMHDYEPLPLNKTPLLVDNEPKFEPIVLKPIFYDLAYDEITSENTVSEQKAQECQDPKDKGFISGMLGGLFSKK